MRLVLLLLLLPACGDVRQSAADAAAGDATQIEDGAPGDGATADALVEVCDECAVGEGCLRASVIRTEDEETKPWNIWPKEVDGHGRLIASAEDSSFELLSRILVAGADMTDPEASYPVDLGCVPAENITVRVFLDDNLTAMPTDITSSDYRDTCLMNRNPIIAVMPDMVNTIVLPLHWTCD